ncbi:MAG: M24 family metallopeptidase [Aggregatilineales bacterium]
MKVDLDRLMAKYNLDVIFILGGEEPNTYRAYLMNGADANGHVIKKRGEPPVAIVNPMEIDEARPSGLTLYTPEDFGAGEIRKQFKGDRAGILKAQMAAYFDKLGLRGRLGLYGTGDVYLTAHLIHEVLSALPGIEVAFDYPASQLFQEAYETKDSAEIEQLKLVARLSSEVVKAVHEFITQHRANSDGLVVNSDGQPLTIGAVKRFIRIQELERGLENNAGMIFAQGRDAGVPHSSGQDDQPLQTGQSIVFDFFPRLISSGYYHDMTRTWSLGYATPEVQAAYDHVMEAFNLVDDSLNVGDDPSLYQGQVCDVFEAHGHKTPRTHPGASEGYVHSLGHGVGLNVHEAPHLNTYSLGESLAPGNVFTVEPGLYYPDRGFGVRVEDTLFFDENGVLQRLTDFPYDLVVPLNG